ncbi:MAG: YjbH domain-containing protein [Paracoccus sp. (in: a-proteobacteria)]
MRRSPLIRQLMATALPFAVMVVPGAAPADPLIARNMSTYGMPGGIDTPTAETLPEGTLGATVSYSDYALRNNVFFQVLPQLTANLRYSRVDGINDYRNDGYIWDRSFDLRYQLVEEQGWRPAVAIGLQDFLGTGVYSGEYIVATRQVTPAVRASIGLGWGTLAGRPRVIDAGDLGGTANTGDWFSGSARPFASVAWSVNDRLTVMAEYSNDIYQATYSDGNFGQQGGTEPGRLNFGASYKVGQNYEFGLYTIGNESIGAQFTVALNPREAAYPSGLEKAPAPVRPRPARAADPEAWSAEWAQDPTAQPAIQKVLADALAGEGQILESMVLSATRAEVRIRNTRYIQQSEAVGRTARLMTRALPATVETLVITSSADGLPTSSVTLRRSDVERLENTEVGRIAAVTDLSDAQPRPAGLVATDGLFPRFRWRVGPYFDLGLFDPEEPLRYEFGAEARASYELLPGLIATGAIRQRAFGDIKQSGPGVPGERGRRYTPDEYLADPSLETTPEGVPRVRSDTRMYAGNSSPIIPELTLAWFAKPSDQIYSRVTVGLLERAYGGASAEVLWKPVNSPLAFGAEVNRVRKRDFDALFNFRDYEVTTGHVSAYYELAQGFTAQLDVGQYLAGDVGATFTLTREFANGWRIGAYATKTDLSAEEFGEGSFDKGVTFSIPISWATGTPSRDRAGSTIRSLSRDGGARVEVNDRLYDKVRDSHAVRMQQGWGAFWR